MLRRTTRAQTPSQPYREIHLRRFKAGDGLAARRVAFTRSRAWLQVPLLPAHSLLAQFEHTQDTLLFSARSSGRIDGAILVLVAQDHLAGTCDLAAVGAEVADAEQFTAGGIAGIFDLFLREFRGESLGRCQEGE